jgi:predicted ATPase
VALAREAQPEFDLTPTNAAAVAEIFRKLDGLPLALELAAARLTVLSPQALLGAVGAPLATADLRPARLAGAAADTAGGHRVELRLADADRAGAVPPARGVVGGFSLDAVERVLDGQPGLDPLEGIASLVDKSLVFVQLIDAAMPWYGMLGTIREFALEKLDASGETGALRRRHAELERDLAERGQARLLVSAERDGWLARFESDHMNVRAALGWTLGADGDLAVGVALAGALVLEEHGPTPGGPRLVRSPAGPMRRRR